MGRQLLKHSDLEGDGERLVGWGGWFVSVGSVGFSLRFLDCAHLLPGATRQLEFAAMEISRRVSIPSKSAIVKEHDKRAS